MPVRQELVSWCYLRKIYKACIEVTMHRGSFVVLFLVLVSSFSYSQTVKPSWASLPQEAESATRAFSPQLRNQLAQIRDAVLSDNYAYQQLEHLTDSIGSR